MLSSSATLSRAFVEELIDAGSVTVAPFDAVVLPAVDDSAREAIAELDAMCRLDLAGNVPPYHPAAAEWALIQFYRFAQLMVSRDIPADVVTAVISTQFAEAITPSIAYSADLFFRLVPDVFRRANEAAPEDALVVALKQWAADWPLSSVRIPLGHPPELDAIIGTPTLWRLYVDRVTAGHANDRWADARVAAQIRTDIGAFPDLASSIVPALDRLPSVSSRSA